MKKTLATVVLLTIFAAGCNTDIVTTKQLKTIKDKRIYVTPIESQDPYIGKVIKDILEKEFIRKKVQLCDAENANIILTGATFLTTRSQGQTSFLNLFGGKQTSAQSIESVSISAKDRTGNVLLTASYNNADQQTASQLAKDFGSSLADKLR
jgi:hypothetical protein